MFSDPGGEVKNAPVGSENWAKRLRLELQSVVDDLPKAASYAEGYFNLIHEHRAWTLLNKEDGSHFETFDEFCSYERPWGLGKPFSEIRPHLEALHGKRTVDLMAVAPDRRANNGANQHTGPREEVDSPHREGNPKPHATEERLRAVLRAPEPVQQLYRDGLIGQREAAKLGPRNPTPEQAGRLAEIATAAARSAREQPAPQTETERRRLQREVNARVRDDLQETNDPVERLQSVFERAYQRFDANARRRIRRWVRSWLERTGRDDN